MSKKFEQLLDYLVNEEMDKANELFHEIVVEKSREIYENMIAEEAEDESVEEADEEEDESVEEADEEEDESVEEGFGMDDDGDETSMSIGGGNDAGDNFMKGVEEPTDDHASAGGDVSAGEEQILDILAQLKMEFDDIVNKGTGGDDATAEPEFDDGDDDTSDEPPFGKKDGEDSEDDEDDDEDDDQEESMGSPMREYVERVGNDWEKNSMKTPGPVGSGKGDLAGQATETNHQSIVASGKGKPTTGATASNILGSKKAGEGSNTGTSPNADKGSRGLVGKTQGEFTKGVEKNKSSSSKSSFGNGSALNKQGSGYPGNNKAPGPVGSGSGDKAGQTGDANGRKGQFLPQHTKP